MSISDTNELSLNCPVRKVSEVQGNWDISSKKISHLVYCSDFPGHKCLILVATDIPVELLIETGHIKELYNLYECIFK